MGIDIDFNFQDDILIQNMTTRKQYNWQSMMIPTKEDCYQLIHEMKILDHIAAHSFQVCRVALLITDNLNQKDKLLNRDLVMSSAILHDITKTRSFETGEMHAETCYFLPYW